MHFRKKPGQLIHRYINGYRQFFCRARDRWEFVHRRVAEKLSGTIPKGHEVHHVDGNKLNNRSENLRVLPRAIHQALHKVDRRSLIRSQPKITRSLRDHRVNSTTSVQLITRADVDLNKIAAPRRSPVEVELATLLGDFLFRSNRFNVRHSLGSSDCGCPRCGGSGYLPQYSHVAGGICFQCGGVEYEYDDPEGGDFETEWKNRYEDLQPFECDWSPSDYDDGGDFGGFCDDCD